MKLPAQYEYLNAEPGPKMILEALKLFGTLEVPGHGDNATIIGWADEIAEGDASAYKKWAAKYYDEDSIPWCGLFEGIIAKRAGKPVPDNYLSAAAWRGFGTPVATAMLGDVLIFTRTGGAHVTNYVGEDAEAYHCLGGNQSDAVTITRILKSRKPDIRRPPYSVQPANVRRIMLTANGSINSKEN